MKERPILFSGPMVRAILEGRKTQTRRVIKARNVRFEDGIWQHDVGDSNYALPCPYGQPGDRLWVRETFFVELPSDLSFEVEGLPLSHWKPRQIEEALYHYRATPDVRNPDDWVWRPSIHMPRWASRITLEIVSVRVERLQDISEEDAQAEGVKTVWTGRHELPCGGVANAEFINYEPPAECELKDVVKAQTFRNRFAQLWDSINGAGSWDANPYVWVVEFKRVDV